MFPFPSARLSLMFQGRAVGVHMSCFSIIRILVAACFAMGVGAFEVAAESDRSSSRVEEEIIIKQVTGYWVISENSPYEPSYGYECGGVMEVNEVVRDSDGRLRFTSRTTNEKGRFSEDEPGSSGIIYFQSVAKNARQLTICLQYDDEDRVTEQGKLARWCMIMAGPDQFVWREQGWPFGEFTAARYRCKGPSA